MSRRAVALAGVVILQGGVAAGAGQWTSGGAYFDELEDTSGLELVQAVAVDVPTTSLRIASSWTWTQPGPTVAGATDTRFSAPGATLDFAQISAAAPSGELLQLSQRFYSAVGNMDWQNDCATLDPLSTRCLLYPVPSAGEEALHGARSGQVLLVPDIARFNDCQTSMACTGSGDYVIASMTLDQYVNRDFLVSGRPYNATWWIRSPGQGPNPPSNPGDYNDRLLGFEIGFAYTAGGVPRTDHLGGATGGCLDVGLGPWCLDRTRGCPVHVRIAAPPEPGSATLYLNKPGSPADSPYTPYSFSFAAGSLAGAASPWDAVGCPGDMTGGMNVALCHDPPQGSWIFAVNTSGTSGAGNAASSSCGTPAVPCMNPRASASAYVDGLTLTAASGVFLSPAFDSLSPKTLWTLVSWETDLNPDAGGVRTPVRFDWRVANDPSGFVYSSAVFDAGVTPAVETDTLAFPGPPVAGRFFQYRAVLTSWDLNTANPPPPRTGNDNCLRFSMAHDGSLTPRVRLFAVRYQPDAGRAVSRPVTPDRLRRWERIEYAKDDGGGGRVVCDILDGPGNVLVAGVASGASLAAIDPGRYASLRVRFTLDRAGTSAAPSVSWFRLVFAPLEGCLALSRNTVRLSYGEDVAVRFCTRKEGRVEVTVHDAAGQMVRKLFHADLVAGEVAQRNWDATTARGNPVSPGLYFVTVATPLGRETARVAVSR